MNTQRSELLADLSRRASLHIGGRVNILNQESFKNGPVTINRSGLWRLSEDIVLHFNPDNDFRPTPGQQTAPFVLGFFAGIIIQTNNVCLDLDGHTIRMSEEFALQQRFFAIIELANTPFIPGQGPGNFGSTLKSASNTIIQNGTLGRSSHHGIHGNGAQRILIRDLTIRDFEIAGIALNGSRNVILHSITIGPNWKKVPILGNYSALRFIGQFCDMVKHKISESEKNDLYDKLDKLKAVEAQVLSQLKDGKVTHPLFANPSGLPDGNNYGVLFHPPGVAINDYTDEDFAGKLAENIYLSNVHVNDLVVKVNEIVALSGADGKGAQTDPSGSVFQITEVTDQDGKYQPNELSEVQLVLADLRNKYDFKLGKLNISKEVIQWAKNSTKIKTLLDGGFKYKCGGDSMHHVGKPVHGFRFDGVKHLWVRDCSATKIVNVGFLGCELAGRYKTSHDQQVRVGYMAAGSLGWNFSHVIDSSLVMLRAREIFSNNGNAIGYRFINGCCRTGLLSFESKQISAGQYKEDDLWYGTTFDETKVEYGNRLPNLLPCAMGVKVEDDNCNLNIRSGDIGDLSAPNLTVPIWNVL